MSIDDILNEAQQKFSELYSSESAITFQQMTYALTQLKLMQIEIPSITSTSDTQLPTAADFLRAGLKHMEDRARTHDTPNGERSIPKTVAAFNIICDSEMTDEEGWMFMGLLKKVRSVQGEFNADNYEDEASFSGLRGECAARERAQKK